MDLSPTHLEGETLARLVDAGPDALTPAEFDHLAGCAACFHEYTAVVRTLLTSGSPSRSSATQDAPATPRPQAPRASQSHEAIAAPARPGLPERLIAALPRPGLILPVGGAAIATALVLLLVLPPRATMPSLAYRGSERFGFIRPVEGEVVGTRAVRLRWQAIPGASEYDLRLLDANGRALWQETTAGTATHLPVNECLPPGRYRVVLGPRPADLAGPGALSVAFRTGDWSQRAAHRLRWSPRVAGWIGLAGLVLLLLGLGPRLRHGRRLHGADRQALESNRRRCRTCT